MANVDAFALQRSDLNRFLFADVGVEANGMTLSVLSTLARSGMDPWDEAGRLARQPRPAAIEGLARLIATMPASLWPLADSTAIAARLVPLLPARGANAAPSVAMAQTAHVTNMGKQLLEMLPLRGKGSPQQAASRPSLRPSGLVLVLLTGLLAGLTLYLVAQRSLSDQDASIPAEVYPAVEPAS